MKDKVLTLILGILIGAVLTAGGFLLFGKNTSSRNMGEKPNRQDMENFIPGQIDPNGIPAKPDKGGTQTNTNQMQNSI